MSSGGHVKALKEHLHSNQFFRVDISQFFNNINRSRVTRILKEFYPSYDIARDIARKSVVPTPLDKKKFILPYGYIQSPIIASICLSKSRLGKFLDEINNDGYVVSVYVDDIIVSDAGNISKPDMDKTYEVLIDVANKCGFPINPDKSTPPSPEVTAFNVTLSANKLTITEQRLQEFLDKALESNQSVIQGILGYVSTISYVQHKIIFDAIE